MAGEPFITVGRIARSHGLKGEVSVIIDHHASLDAIVGVEAWVVPPPAGARSTRILSHRPGPKGPLLTLAGYTSIDEAQTLTGRELLVRTADVPDGWGETVEEPDVLGTRVHDEAHGDLGRIVETIETGANDVWVVEGRFGEVLVPVIDDVVVSAEEGADEFVVRLLPGLLPGEAEEA